MQQNRRIAIVLNFVFGVLFGTLIFRLMLGPAFNYPALYTRITWITLYPVNLLRGFGNDYIYVLFYALFWLYVFSIKIVIIEAPFGRTLLKTLIWMPLMVLPFLPFGIEYFSLVRYITSIDSYLLRILPFIGLIVFLFLANRFYFDQKYVFAGVWALVNFLLIIVIITISDLLPLIKSQFFFHALGYRLSLANSITSNAPILALFVIIGLAIFYVSVFERQFLRLPFKRPTLFSIITPIGILVALSFILMIIRDDFRRYRYFDYQGGIATVYFAKYDDRQILSFDDARFTLSTGRYSVFYPFGKFNIHDTLHRHAEEILRMKMIEGLDYYRLERIMKILAHGPRDEDTYSKLRHVVHDDRYLLPEGFRYWARYVEHRYTLPPNDIAVTGWLMLNGRPLGNAEFFVNRVSINNRRTVEPIWQGVTDPDGRFAFTCYRDIDSDDAYFNMTFLVSDRLFNDDFGFFKLVNPVPVFREPAVYTLDTLQIETGLRDEAARVHYLRIKTSSDIDSLSMFLPSLFAGGGRVVITGLVSRGGLLDSVAVEHWPLLSDSSIYEGTRERAKRARIYLKDSAGTFDIEVY